MILAGHRELVAAWVAERIRDFELPKQDYEALGVLKDGNLIGGVIYNEFRGHDIRMHCAGEPGWLTKATLRAFFSYPFIQLQCCRVTGTVAKANKQARRLNERLGFVMEGCLRDGLKEGKDLIIYGMKRSECRWIDGD